MLRPDCIPTHGLSHSRAIKDRDDCGIQLAGIFISYI
jgi:hypothetical protein